MDRLRRYFTLSHTYMGANNPGTTLLSVGLIMLQSTQAQDPNADLEQVVNGILDLYQEICIPLDALEMLDHSDQILARRFG